MIQSETDIRCDACNRKFDKSSEVRNNLSMALPLGFSAYHDVCDRCIRKAEQVIRDAFPKGKPKLTLWVSKLEEVKPVA